MYNEEEHEAQSLLKDIAAKHRVPDSLMPSIFELLDNYPKLKYGDMQELQRKLDMLISTAIKDANMSN